MALRSMLLAGVFAALIAIGSQVYVPIGPVPHTLQVFFVMLTGVVLGGRWGFTSVAVWILLGVFGLPVFTQGKAGIAVLAGPTGGFLIGFLASAFIVGWLTERYPATFARTAAFMVLGMVVVYGLGFAGFMASFTYFLHKPMTVNTAMALAVLPFLPFDILKALAAAYIGVKVRRGLSAAGYLQLKQ